MILVPAIDLRRGGVVRLRRGSDDARTAYAESPQDAARRWAAAGAELIHVVDLDAAFGEPPQRKLVGDIIAACGVPVEVGGGVRALDDFRELEGLGAARIVFGTAAVTRPEAVERALEHAPEKVVVGVDVKEGAVATHGWTRGERGSTPEAFGRHWHDCGVSHFVYTDVSRDGVMIGVNVEATAAFARATGGGVLASGGVGSVEHLRAFRGVEGIEGVIAGKALYEKAFDFEEGRAALA